ncbi:hypothetical protein HAX54_025714, partial [Datura stramonium]|nr:hypothetical protein [Datura stramonium]
LSQRDEARAAAPSPARWKVHNNTVQARWHVLRGTGRGSGKRRRGKDSKMGKKLISYFN